MSKASVERTKVVVRSLPPTLSKEAFVSTIDKHVEGTYNWLAYYPGKVSIKRTVFSRAFLNFNTPEAVYAFKARFDGHVFVSTRGTQYRCSVEYAPFQKVPNLNPKKLAMEGTIEKDPTYQAFVQALEEGPKALPTAQAQLEEQAAARSAQESGPVVTALMAFLQKKYESTPFTGRRGTKGARSRREAMRDVIYEEEDESTAKPSKGRGKPSSRGSRAAEADAAAAAAAAAGAASQALKGTRQKQKSKQTKAQQQQVEHAEAAAAAAVAKGKKHGSSASAASKDAGPTEAVAEDQPVATGSRPSKRAPAVASTKAAGIPVAAAAAMKPSSSRAAPSTAAEDKAAVAAKEAEDEEVKRAAAAALAAASAANAAAAAARKSRVKAGHQIYTPGAGSRLFAAALPTAGRGAARGEAAATAAAETTSEKAARESTDRAVPNDGGSGQAAATSTPTVAVGRRASSSTAGKPARGGRSSNTAADADDAARSKPSPAVSTAGGASKVSSAAADAVTACMSKLQMQDSGDATGSTAAGSGTAADGKKPGRAVSSSSSSKGGRGGKGSRSHGRQQHDQQQQWVPKPGPG